MKFGQDYDPWGTTGRDLHNGASVLCIFEGLQDVHANFKAASTIMQTNR